MRANRLLLVAAAWVLALPSQPIWAGNTWGGGLHSFPFRSAYVGGVSRRWARRGARLLPLVAACLLAAASPAAAQVGAEEADSEGLWGLRVHYDLHPAGPDRVRAADRIVLYRPRGDYYRRRAPRLTVTVGYRGTVREMELVVARDFIDHSTETLFARSLVERFLRAAVPEADQPAVRTLLDEIHFRREPSPAITIHGEPVPALPARPSGGYLAFAGRAPAYERRLGTTFLRLRNATEGGRPVLIVTVNG
jgi:hypothetical protein